MVSLTQLCWRYHSLPLRQRDGLYIETGPRFLMTSCFLLRSCSTTISTGTDFYQYFMLPCHWWPWRVHWAHDSQSHLALCIWSKCNPALPKKISLPPFEILWVHARSWCKLATWSSFHIMYVDYMPTWLTENGWHISDDIVTCIPWIHF